MQQFHTLQLFIPTKPVLKEQNWAEQADILNQLQTTALLVNVH